MKDPPLHMILDPPRFARRLRGRRTAAMVAVALTLSVAAVMVPIAVFEGSLAAQAAWAEGVVALTPAPGQPDPTSLWDSEPIPAVAAAANAAKRHARLPKAMVPSMQELEQENATGGGIIPADCEPAFGSGVSANVCPLGDTASARVVVVLGDSHAGTWMPAMVAVALRQHFAVVPLEKPGCFVSRVNTDLPGWPCASWYQWALAQDKALHPVATIVTFLLSTPLQRHRASTVSDMKAVLSQVTNGVFLSDPPSQNQQTDVCISKPKANMGKCSARVPRAYVSLMKALARMTARTHHPAIPTLQWFCADGVCPMVIDNTLTTRDGSHMTQEYSTALAPLLSLELRPILARLNR
jgi:SGNH domain (fused to AT3 domains)